MARKYGMRSGYVESINQVSGTVTVDTGTSASVSFDEAMENPPAVVLTADTAGEDPYVSAVTETGFTVDGLTADAGVTVHYVAIDESRY